MHECIIDATKMQTDDGLRKLRLDQRRFRPEIRLCPERAETGTVRPATRDLGEFRGPFLRVRNRVFSHKTCRFGREKGLNKVKIRMRYP